MTAVRGGPAPGSFPRTAVLYCIVKYNITGLSDVSYNSDIQVFHSLLTLLAPLLTLLTRRTEKLIYFVLLCSGSGMCTQGFLDKYTRPITRRLQLFSAY